jgi:hypothetical protein
VGIALLLLAVSRAHAEESTGFHLHTVNAKSTYSACAAIDVNKDGKLDIVCGGFWYEAPSWKKHFLREVQQIRGRYDDYSHLPMDVNGDGWMDYVSANYRSKSIYWVENPGQEGGRWAKHMVDEPGPMETAILADVDGDGQLDVLPNGTKFAAWWELTRVGNVKSLKPKWTRHELPLGIAGHGLGFGDVNGDGRGDIVSPHGWLEAPKDRRKGVWRLHHEFAIDRDCSVPMLVVDVDRDGDNDIVWGRGHNLGLYWLEQGDVGFAGKWSRHAIDTEWSQPHAIRWADMDGDGHGELVAGKRYMAHDGKDPGAYDPLVAYWYDFDTKTRSWRRHAISSGGPAGFGLDPKVVDLDHDGDLDVVSSGRSGLYWFENRLVNKLNLKSPSIAVASPKYDNHQQVMIVKDGEGKPRPVETPFDLALRRKHILAGMQEAMGEFPENARRVPLDWQMEGEVETEKYTRLRISYVSEPGDRVPAYLLIPRGTNARNKAAAMLCLHQTTKIGKGEPAGLGGRPSLHYAHELAERGFVCLVPDYPSFGDYPYDFKKQGSHYASGTMKAIWNNIRGIDLLLATGYADSDRIGCIGHSLGGHNSLYTAAFDQRIRAVVTSCSFDPFHHYMNGKLAGWTSDRYMPRIRDLYNNDPDQMPFDFYEVLTAICPRALFINAPLHDSNFQVAGVRKAVEEVGKAYELRKARDKLVAKYPDSAHDFPDKIRQEVYEWLEMRLK